MSVANIHKEKAAKKALEFYGFWLWNYTQPFSYCLDEEFIDDADGSHEKNLSDDIIPCKYSYLYSHDTGEFDFDVPQETITRQRLDAFRSSVFKPWDIYGHSIILPDNHIQLRNTAENILLNSYDLLCGNQSQMITMGYILKDTHGSVSVIDFTHIPEEPLYDRLTSQDLLQVTMDLSKPLDTILADITKIHAAWTQKGISPLNVDNVDASALDIANRYTSILRELKSFPNVSFAVKTRGSRSLGFWLWENTDYNKRFASVREAVDFIQSGKALPDDLLHIFGYADSDLTVFNRLRALTRQCISQGEVMSMG